MAEVKKNLTLAELRALAAIAKETAVDMTEEQKGGGGGRLLPEGYTMARMSGVIEYGLQPQEFEGKPTADADEVQLEFVLYDEGYCNEDGTPYVVRTWPFKVSRTAKSNAFKLFKSLNWQGLHTTWIDLIGEPILLKIKQTEHKTTKKKTSSIDTLGFLPPINPRTKKPEECPEFDEQFLRFFLWDQPTMDCWDLLEIKGENDDGRSKNFLQEKLLGARNFAGSALEELLLGNGVAFKIPEPTAKANGSKSEAAKAAGTGAAMPGAANEDEPSEEDAKRVADAPFEGGTVVENAEEGEEFDMPDMVA
jgi:hypothetical protein